jgi:alpha-tubulin suppressor-like RCC1 family protein
MGSRNRIVQTMRVIVTVAIAWGLFPLATYAQVVTAWGDSTHGQSDVPEGLTGVTAIAGGAEFSLALKSDGTVVQWGDLRDGGGTDLPPGLTGVTDIAVGSSHGLAIKLDSTVVAWGWDGYNQNVVPPGLSRVIAVAGGFGFSLALKSDNTVVAWGRPLEVVDHVSSLRNVIAIAAGERHALAIKSDSTVVAWGLNFEGRTDVPSGLTGVIDIAGGDLHSLALKSDGTVIAWGDNAFNQLDVPSDLTDVIAIAAGKNYSLAFKQNGTVIAWGTEYQNKNHTAQMDPPPGVTGLTAIAAGYNHSLGLWRVPTPIISTPCLLTFGDVPLLGGSAADTLTTKIKNAGDAALSVSGVSVGGTDASAFTVTSSTSFTVAPGDSVLLAVALSATTVGRKDASLVLTHNDAAAGSETTIALHAVVYEREAGTVVAWGNNLTGQTIVPGNLTDVTIAIAAGNGHNQALRSDGTVAGWGHAQMLPSSGPLGLTGVIDIAGGDFHSLALKSDGTVEAWGDPGYSQFWEVPDGLTDVTAVAAGSIHSLALKSDGTVEAWGYDSFGAATVPDGLTCVIAIAAGSSHSLALKLDGTVVAWGLLVEGEPGVPVGLTGVKAIAAGKNHNLALKLDGTVVAWGKDSDGQSTVPDGLAGVTAISAGGGHSLALASEGTVVAWGRDSSGQATVPQDLPHVTAIAAGGNHSLALTSPPLPGFGPVKVSIGTAFGASGDTLSIPVTLANPNLSSVGGLQLKVSPDNINDITFVGLEDTVSNPGMTVSANSINSNTTMVVFSSTGAVIPPGSNIPLATLVYTIGPGAALGTTLNLVLSGIEVGDSLGVALPDSSIDGQIQIGIRGDVNLDGDVSILDVIKLVRALIGKDATPDSRTVTFNIADMNEDGLINIADVIFQVNSVLGITPKLIASGPTAPVIVSLNTVQTLTHGQTVIPVSFDANGLVAGAQFTFTFDPTMVDVGTPYLVGEGLATDSHTIDGIMQVVVYGLTPGAGIKPGQALYIPVAVRDGSPSLTLTDIILVNPSAQRVDVTLGETTIVVKDVAVPTSFALDDARPNPFNPSTTISYAVSEQAHVTLIIYNVLGQQVIRLVDTDHVQGNYSVVWNGSNDRGLSVASGVYVYRITSSTGYTDTKRMTLLK